SFELLGLFRYVTQQRIRIERGSRSPPFILRVHPPDCEMKMRRRRVGVAAGADGTEPLSSLNPAPFVQVGRIRLQVSVIVDGSTVGQPDVDSISAVVRHEELLDHTGGCCQYRRA